MHYTYDNFHRRISQSTNSKTFYYIYFGQREVGLYNPASQKLQEYRVLALGKGAELGASVAIQLGDTIYSPLHDHRGNIICLLDAKSGLPKETYRYTAFGEAETHSSNKPLNNPWGFMSKRIDPETGFVYFSRRYYTPTTGRWLTPDPLGFADGPNIYAYVHANPMTKFDLYGLMCVVLPFETEDGNFDPEQALNKFAYEFQRPWDGDFWLEKYSNFAYNLRDTLHSMGMPTGRVLAKATVKTQGIFGRIVRNLGISNEALKATKQTANSTVGGLEGIISQRLDLDAQRMVNTHLNLNNPTHPCFKNWTNLNKSIANQQQMKETGRLVAGPGSNKPFRDAIYKAKEYGGNPEDWVKKSSSEYIAPDGKKIECHWIENLKTGERQEFKSIFDKDRKGILERDKNK